MSLEVGLLIYSGSTWSSNIRKYKGATNHMVDLLSRPPPQILQIFYVRCVAYEYWKYASDPFFSTIWTALQQPIVINQTPFLDYHIQDGWLYKFDKICVPTTDDRLVLIHEAHASSYGRNFDTFKTTQHIQYHFFWPALQCQVEKFIRSCTLCSQHKSANHKYGLYQPLHIPSHPWEYISMDFIIGLPMTFRHHDAIWVVVCRFSKMAIFVPCTKTTTATQTTYLFFTHVWTHFGLPSSIISNRAACFLNTFWKTLWSLLGCHLKYSTSFHPQMDGQTKLLTVVWSMPSTFSLPNLNSGMPPSTLSNTVIIGKFMFLLACPLSKLALGINLLPPMSFLYSSNLLVLPDNKKRKPLPRPFCKPWLINKLKFMRLYKLPNNIIRPIMMCT
jgi:hypothetical protein